MSFKFLSVLITNKLSWSKHTKKVAKRARQCLFPPRRLKRFGMVPQILKKFYSCTVKSILTGFITARYGNCSASDRSAYSPVHHWGRVSCHPGPIYWALSEELSKTPVTQVINCSLCYRTASGTTGVQSLGPRLLNSFYLQAIRMLNN